MMSVVERKVTICLITNWLMVSLVSILTFIIMALNDYNDLECEANGMTTPHEKAKRRTEVERISITERMADFWKDYEV